MKKSSSRLVKLLLITFCTLISYTSCKNNNSEKSPEGISETDADLFFKISLAQWSLSGPILAGEMDPMDFAEKANEMGFEGIEYVNQLYNKKLEDYGNTPQGMQRLLDSLKSKSEQFNVENVLIMIDGEGELASANEEERNQAVENHKKWVDAAEYLGAHSIRDRKSTRLNSSHVKISYAVFCLKKTIKKTKTRH